MHRTILDLGLDSFQNAWVGMAQNKRGQVAEKKSFASLYLKNLTDGLIILKHREDDNALGRSMQKSSSNANESNRWCKIEKKPRSITIGIYYK